MTRYTIDSRFNLDETLNDEAKLALTKTYNSDTSTILDSMFEHMLKWIKKVDDSDS